MLCIINLYMMMTILSISMMIMKHPLSITMMLIAQTTLTAMATGMLNYDFWFSYILFMIMIGGMLVVFIYMTSIASNEKFNFYKIWTLTPMIIMLPSMASYIMNKNNDMKMMYMEKSNLISLEKFYSWPSNSMIIMMIIYLLITLIATVKITSTSSGPLRQKK
uniref:NADH-ubiquinone oxidoreductase chain 6 n=1 Tax=Ptinus rufipes TaxID=904172 RepID=E3VTC5_9COLE|nr:NADH dehydrogenase subunit 6 [Ptinus rufipes]